MLVRCQSHLIANELFSEDTEIFRFNIASRKYWRSFVNHPDDISLISSTGDITVKPPTNIRLADNFKVTHLPADSFTKSIKIDSGVFTTLEEGNNEIHSAGTPLPLLKRRTH